MTNKRSTIQVKGVHNSHSSYIVYVENGKTQTVSLSKMSHAGTFHDRGGLSKAEALDKHGQRVDTVFPKAVGSVHEKNIQGQKILDEILNHPDKTIKIRDDATARIDTSVIDIRLPDGRIRFTKDGKKFIHFWSLENE